MARAREADVAIYAPQATAFYAHDGGRTGGAELQSFYLARALADAGLRVRHIVEAEPGQKLQPHHEGIELVPLARKGGRRALARRRGIVEALARANARVYVQRSAGYETGMVGAWTRLARRRFLFSSSSDVDFILDRDTARRAGAGLDRRAILLQYRLGGRLSDLIVVQTDRQRELARRCFGVEARVVRSFAEVADDPPKTREAFLWIGGGIDLKDPLAYVELARRVPEAHFWMLVTEREVARDLVVRLREQAKAVPNLELLSARPRSEALELYRRAVALVNTSYLEGFPNTFLEAWSHGTPVLSLRVDPDGLIEGNGLGVVAGGSLERLGEAARERWGARESAHSEAVQAYVRRMHDPSVVGPQWAAIIRELAT